MDLFFHDPSEIPLPPNEVRIKDINATPWFDQDRIRVYIELDPFQQSPNAEVIILDNIDKSELASTTIIGSTTRKMEFTLHLRGPHPPGEYILRVILFYSPPVPLPEENLSQIPDLEPIIIDQKEIQFQIK